MLAAKWYLIALNNFNPKWVKIWMSVFNSRDVKVLQLLPFVLNFFCVSKKLSSKFNHFVF